MVDTLLPNKLKAMKVIEISTFILNFFFVIAIEVGMRKNKRNPHIRKK